MGQPWPNALRPDAQPRAADATRPASPTPSRCATLLSARHGRLPDSVPRCGHGALRLASGREYSQGTHVVVRTFEIDRPISARLRACDGPVLPRRPLHMRLRLRDSKRALAWHRAGGSAVGTAGRAVRACCVRRTDTHQLIPPLVAEPIWQRRPGSAASPRPLLPRPSRLGRALGRRRRGLRRPLLAHPCEEDAGRCVERVHCVHNPQRLDLFSQRM
jgi:hypothetical protein